MGGFFLSVRGSWLSAAALAILLAAGGCGGSDSSAADVTVETGSLSKAQFIKRADAICEANRAQFTREFTAFAQKIQRSSKAAQEASNDDPVEKILIPNFQKDINEISNLGAPSGDEQEVGAFLEALGQRLEEIRERPTILEETVTPFAKAEKLAKAYGLTGCAESFS
jgi:hypothetical protein